MVRKLVIRSPPLGLYLNFYFLGYTEYTEYTVNNGAGFGCVPCFSPEYTEYTNRRHSSCFAIM